MTEKTARRRFTPTVSLGDHLTEEAQRLRKEARGTPPGVKRERMIRQARQLETAADVNKWIASPGLAPPT
jgi:hypothetical protein